MDLWRPLRDPAQRPQTVFTEMLKTTSGPLPEGVPAERVGEGRTNMYIFINQENG